MITRFESLVEALVFCGMNKEKADDRADIVNVVGSTVINLGNNVQIQVCDYRGLAGYDVNWQLARYEGDHAVMTARCNVAR